MAACTTKSCVLFVNDGSKDKSLQWIRELCLRNKDVLYLSIARNAGLSAAIKAGIEYTGSLYVGYMNANLQTSPADVEVLLQYAEE